MSWVWEITQERHIGILCFDSPFRKSCCYFISSQQITWCSGEENRADSDTKDVINGVVFWHITSDSSPVERVCTFCVVKLSKTLTLWDCLLLLCDLKRAFRKLHCKYNRILWRIVTQRFNFCNMYVMLH